MQVRTYINRQLPLVLKNVTTNWNEKAERVVGLVGLDIGL
jgi:hypothetical protein